MSRALPKPKNSLLDQLLLDADDDFSEPIKSSGNLGVNGIADSIKRKTPEGAISEVLLEHSVLTIPEKVTPAHVADFTQSGRPRATYASNPAGSFLHELDFNLADVSRLDSHARRR